MCLLLCRVAGWVCGCVCTHCAACHCRHCLQLSRCAAVPRSGVCLCRQRPREPCRQAAICMGSLSRRRAPSRSEDAQGHGTGHLKPSFHWQVDAAQAHSWPLDNPELKATQKHVLWAVQCLRGDTYIDHPGTVASAQVVEHRGLIEVCQHGHVFHHVILRRIHLLDVTLLHCHSLRWWMQKGMRRKSCIIVKVLWAGVSAEMDVYLPIFGLPNDFVTADLLDLNLNVSLFFIRDPSAFLTWQKSREVSMTGGFGEWITII